MTPEEEHHKLSTSALAKALGVSSQQLFSTLKDYGWIKRLEDGWALTAKGEFEGGEYVHSKRYGRYIVWPDDLLSHRLFCALEDNRSLSASALGKSYGLSAREVNRLLAELGWIKHGCQGWELTRQGEQRGGVQLENESSGVFYVLWPQAVEHDEILQRQLSAAHDINQCAAAQEQEPDLFSADGYDAAKGSYTALDGHILYNKTKLRVCHWLYMSGIAHACQRRLPCQEALFADFYLPAQQIYIECWGENKSSAEIAAMMKRKAFYQASGLTVIDIEAAEVAGLDEMLTRQLRKHGLRVV